MAKLIYSAIMSLDGYVADEEGKFDWAAPDEEVHRLVNDLERPVGTYLYGRRMYEVMVYWETADTLPDQPTAGRQASGGTRSPGPAPAAPRSPPEPGRDHDQHTHPPTPATRSSTGRRLPPARPRHPAQVGNDPRSHGSHRIA